MKKNEFIIIGDIIKSRFKFQADEWEHFHISIENINKLHAAKLKIPFTIYSGDSFGSVCKDLDAAIEIILALQETQKHQKSRIALIEGEVSFGINKNNFLTLEGPALWKSDEILRSLKKKKLLFTADLQNEFLSLTTNTLLNLILSNRSSWNNQEWEIYKNFKKGVKQKDLAQLIGISQQYVSKIIKQSGFRLMSESEENIKKIINGIYSNIYRTK